MTSQPTGTPFTPAGRVALLALVLALVGVTGIVSFIESSRVEIPLLALPVAIGLLTRREFWRMAALVYAVVQAAVTFGFIAFLLRIAASQPAATATGPYAPWHPTFLTIAPAVFIVVSAFTVLRQPEVKVLFQPIRTAPGAKPRHAADSLRSPLMPDVRLPKLSSSLYFRYMSPRALQQILRLPVDERIELVQAIWDSVVADSAAVPVTAAQRRQLDARLTDLKARPSAGRPWPAVRASLLKKK